MEQLTTLTQEDIAILAWKKRELEINADVKRLSNELTILETPYLEFIRSKFIEIEEQWKQQIEEFNDKLSVFNLRLIFNNVENWWGYYRNDYDSKRNLDWKTSFRLNCNMIDLVSEEEDSFYDDEIMTFLIDRCKPGFEYYYEFSFKTFNPDLFEQCVNLYKEINNVKEQLNGKTKFIEDFRAALVLSKLNANLEASNLYQNTIENMKLLQ